MASNLLLKYSASLLALSGVGVATT